MKKQLILFSLVILFSMAFVSALQCNSNTQIADCTGLSSSTCKNYHFSPAAGVWINCFWTGYACIPSGYCVPKDIPSCINPTYMNLDDYNKVYTLKNSIQGFSTGGDCIYMTGVNVTLDLNGYTIYGRNLTEAENTGVHLYGASNCTITNGSIKDFKFNVHIDYSSYNLFNKLNISHAKSKAVYMGFPSSYGEEGNTLSNINIFSSNDNQGYALLVDAYEKNSVFKNITVYGANLTEHSSNFGIAACGNNNYFENIVVHGNNSFEYGFVLYYFSTSFHAKNTTIKNSKSFNSTHGIFFDSGGVSSYIYDSNFSRNIMDVETGYYSYDGIKPNVTFINSTYSTENITSVGTLYRKWYYRAYVNDSLGNPLDSAIITAMNKSNNIEFTAFTDAIGFTPVQEITDYVNIGGTRSYYSPYNIVASKVGYASQNHALNVTATQNKLDDFFTLGCWGKNGNILTILKGCVYQLNKGENYFI